MCNNMYYRTDNISGKTDVLKMKPEVTCGGARVMLITELTVRTYISPTAHC